MSYFEWSASVELDHLVIDAEHRHLMDLLNELVGAIFDRPERWQNSRPKRAERVAAVIDALATATAAHFSTEEALMRESAYPGSVEHAEQHASLLHDFGEFTERFHAQKTDSLPHELRYLRVWFVDHIEHHDTPLVAWLKERSAAV